MLAGGRGLRWKESLGFQWYGGGLAGAEAVQDAAEPGIADGEAGGGEKGGVDLTGFAGGEEGS
jgi:hypothetical protein